MAFFFNFALLYMVYFTLLTLFVLNKLLVFLRLYEEKKNI